MKDADGTVGTAELADLDSDVFKAFDALSPETMGLLNQDDLAAAGRGTRAELVGGAPRLGGRLGDEAARRDRGREGRAPRSRAGAVRGRPGGGRLRRGQPVVARKGNHHDAQRTRSGRDGGTDGGGRRHGDGRVGTGSPAPGEQVRGSGRPVRAAADGRRDAGRLQRPAPWRRTRPRRSSSWRSCTRRGRSRTRSSRRRRPRSSGSDHGNAGGPPERASCLGSDPSDGSGGDVATVRRQRPDHGDVDRDDRDRRDRCVRQPRERRGRARRSR